MAGKPDAPVLLLPVNALSNRTGSTMGAFISLILFLVITAICITILSGVIWYSGANLTARLYFKASSYSPGKATFVMLLENSVRGFQENRKRVSVFSGLRSKYIFPRGYSDL